MTKFSTKYSLPLLGLLTLLANPINAEEVTATEADVTNKAKTETIRVEDSYGAIEEERVQAMRSEIRYVPTGSVDGYNLVDAASSQGKSQNVHQNQNMMIPSWNLFSW